MKTLLALALLAASFVVVGCNKEEKTTVGAEKEPGFVMVPAQGDPNYKK